MRLIDILLQKSGKCKGKLVNLLTRLFRVYYNQGMNTTIYTIDLDNMNVSYMEEAGKLIAEGELVAFPTETVYGLGGDALHPEAAQKIYAAKGRPSDNPLIVHIADVSDLDRVAREVPKQARLLAEAFWPGPLTMVVWKKDEVPYATTGGLDTVQCVCRTIR